MQRRGYRLQLAAFDWTQEARVVLDTNHLRFCAGREVGSDRTDGFYGATINAAVHQTERLQMLRPHRPPNLDTFGSGLDQPHPHGAEPTFAFLVVEWASHVPLVTRCAAHANRRTGAAAELHRHGCSCEWDCC